MQELGERRRSPELGAWFQFRSVPISEDKWLKALTDPYPDFLSYT